MKTNLLKSGKRLLSIILSICIVASVCVTGVSFAVSADETATNVNAVDYWDGTTATAYAGGSGTEADPYIIATAAQLNYMVASGGRLITDSSKAAYFKVADGVTAFYLSEYDGDTITTQRNWLANISTVSNSSTSTSAFIGHFDGNGVTVYGLVATACNKNSAANAGFIPVVGNGEVVIKNVNFVDASITPTISGWGGAGVIVGSGNRYYGSDSSKTEYQAYYNDSITIKNCSVRNAVVKIPHAANSSDGYTHNWAGGIIGNAMYQPTTIESCLVEGLTIENCTESTCSVTTHGAFYGGRNIGKDYVSISDSVAINLTGTTVVAATSATFSNVYTDTTVDSSGITVLASGTDITGEAARTAMPALAWGLAWQTNDGSYPTPFDSGIKYDIWDGTADTDFATADGEAMSETNPYIIDSAEKLYGMVNSKGSLGAYFKVSDDIDIFLMNSVYGMTSAEAVTFLEANGQKWTTSTTAFTNKFDGNGASIVGLYGSGSSQAVAFIPVAGDGATVENTKFDTCYFTTSGNKTGLAGSASVIFGYSNGGGSITTAWVLTAENCEITNCKVKGSYANTLIVGGIWAASLTVNNIVTYNNDIFESEDDSTFTVGDNHKYQNGVLVGDFYNRNATDVKVTATNVLSVDASNIAGNKSITSYLNCTNVYAKQVGGNQSAATGISAISATQGYAVYAAASGLDWVKTFTANDGEYPTLKLFQYGEECFYSGGSGTEADPYLISNACDLANMVKFNGYKPIDADGIYTIGTEAAWHKLTNDIQINPVKEMKLEAAKTYLAASGTAWAHTDYTGTAGVFAGSIDGDYHTIYGLYVSGSHAGGLVNKLTGTIKVNNLAFSKAYFNATSRIAIFASEESSLTSGEFNNCALVDSYLYTTSSTWGTIGGFMFSHSNKVNFNNCLSDITLEAPNANGIGAFSAYGTSVYTDCIARNTFFTDNANTSSNYINNSTFNNCAIDTKPAYDISAKNITYVSSENVDETYPTMWLSVDYDEYLSAENWGNGAGENDGLIEPADFVKTNFILWDGSADTTWDTKDGTTTNAGSATNPYILYTAEEVYGMVSSGGSSGSYFEMADGITEIYFNNIKGKTASEAQTYFADTTTTKNAWSTTTDFNGHFDGKGVKLIGLYNTSSSYTAFIPRVNGGTADIKNVQFDKCYFTSTATDWRNAAAVVVGGSVNAVASKIILDSIIVSDSYVSCTCGAAVVGGLAGANTLTASNVLTYGNTISGGTNTTASVLGDIYTTNGTNYPITVTLSNVVSADSVNVVVNQKAKLSEGLSASGYTIAYSNVYAAAWPSNVTADASHYTVLTADNMSGSNAVTNLSATLGTENWVYLSDTYPVPAVFHTHAWSETSTTVKSACANGTDVVYNTCTIDKNCLAKKLSDGTIQYTEITTAGHVESKEYYSDAEGHWKICSNGCGYSFDKADHTYDAWYKTTNADGDTVSERACQACGYKDTLGYVFWDGTAATGYADGDGSEADPYIIETAEQLYLMVSSGGNDKYYKIADGVKTLYLNKVKDVERDGLATYYADSSAPVRNWYVPASNTSNPWTGHFNGNGATIVGAYATTSTNAVPLGFIPLYGDNATVENVHFDKFYFNNQYDAWRNMVGVVLGCSANVTLEEAETHYVTIDRVTVSNSYIKVANTTANCAASLTLGGVRFTGVTDTVSNVKVSNILTYGNKIDAGESVPQGLFAPHTYIGNGSVSTNLSLLVSAEEDGSLGRSDMIKNVNVVYSANKTEYADNTIGVKTFTASDILGAAAIEALPDILWGLSWQAGSTGNYPTFIYPEFDSWSGGSDTDWEGKGTQNDPYIIETADELYGMVISGGKDSNGNAAYFKVADGVKELHLNPVKDLTSHTNIRTFLASDGENWSAAMTTDTPAFVGKFDGNGVTIYGLYSSQPGSSFGNVVAGFVPAMGTDAVIKNVNFDKSCVTGGNTVGTITSRFVDGATGLVISNVSVTNAYVAATTAAPTTDATYGRVDAGAVGGIAASHSNAKIAVNNCIFEGELVNNYNNGYNRAGIIARPLEWGIGVSMQNCISVGYSPIGDGVLKADEWGKNYAVSNTYTNVDLSSNAFASQTGGMQYVNTNAFNKTNIPTLNWNSWKENAMTTLNSVTIPLPVTMSEWTVVTITTLDDGIIDDYSVFDGGNGTKTKPYGISTADQLYMAVLTGGQRYGTPLYFKLTADINLTGAIWPTSETANYTAFIGGLDGDGHTVKGLTVTSFDSGASVGLIPVVGAGAQITDIHLNNVSVVSSDTTSSYVGALIGSVSSGVNLKISNISVENANISGATAGGIIGSVADGATLTLTNVYFTGEATDGFIGSNSGTATVKNAYTTLVSAETLSYTVDNCYYGVTVGSLKASQLGDDWYQGNSNEFLPKLNSWAAAQETLDMHGDGEVAGEYNADDLASIRSRLLRRSAYKAVYGDITYDGAVDIRDLMILKRSTAGSYADMDEGFWPNVAQQEYTIVYENNDHRDLATRLQNYFIDTLGVELTVVDASVEGATIPEKQIIALGDISDLGLACSSQNTPKFGLDTTTYHKVNTEDTDGMEQDYIIWFDSAFVTGVEEAVDLFIEYAEPYGSLITIEGSFWEEGNYVTVTSNADADADADGELDVLFADTDGEYKSYKKLTWINDVKYNYVWGDEFDQTYVNDGDGEYYYDHNTWRVSHSLTFFDDVEVAMPEDIKDFNYISNGKLVMHNDVSGNYWSGKVNSHNGFTTITSSHKYATGGTFDTRDSMIFKRGYAELVAQVPGVDDNGNTVNHVFPAWWLYGNSFTNNSGVDNTLYNKVYDINSSYDGSTNTFNPTDALTYKYKVPYAAIEIDIFEVMNTTKAVLWWSSAVTNYGYTIHKRYMNTVTDGTIYDTFGTGAELSNSTNVSGWTSNTTDDDERSWVQKDSNSYNSTQSYSERTYYFLWTETGLSFWDSDNTTKRTYTFTDADKDDFEVYLYMLLDNHIYTPASGSNNDGTVPTQDLIVESVRLYQAAGERAVITPESKAINGTDN